MIYDIKGFGVRSSNDKGSDDGLILIVPLSMFYFVKICVICWDHWCLTCHDVFLQG
jgi:hypothetical protein